MRLVRGIGVEWGVEWVIKHLLETHLKPVDLDETFEESVRGCYPETVKVGWLELDTVSVLREIDEVSWDMARDEWASTEADDGRLVSLDNGGTYYWTDEIERFIDENLDESVEGRAS